MKHLTALFFFLVTAAQAEQFQAPVTDTEWLVTESPLECSLSQKITGFGSAKFTQLPGQEFSLTFITSLHPSKQTNIYFEIAEAPWQNTDERLYLSSVSAKNNQKEFTISGELAKQAFTYIDEGKFPTIRYQGHKSGGEIDVLLSTIHFRDSHLAFTQCVEALSPYTFEQMRNLTVHFNLEESTLHQDAKEALTKIADYVKIDDKVKQILVSGHTDNHGRKRINIPLAEARAVVVKNFLIEECDVPEKLITTSWHREFIAATTNKTLAGRAQNRRAEIELIR